MLSYKSLDGLAQVVGFQIVVDFQQYGLVEVVGLGLVEFVEPSLDRRPLHPIRSVRQQRRFSRCRCSGGGGQFGDRLVAQHQTRRQPDPLLPCARDNLNTLNRIATRLEEVVPYADRRYTDDVGPEAAESRFYLVPGCLEGAVLCRSSWFGERCAVNLAIGVEGELVQDRDGCRNHVVRQLLSQIGAQLSYHVVNRSPRRGIAMTHDIGGQFLLVALRFTDQSGGLAHQIMVIQHTFQFAWFHPIAANLGLLVETTEELDGAIVQVASQVACPVDGIVPDTCYRVGDEPLAGQVRPIQIPPGQTISGRQQLSGHADGNGLHALIDDVDATVGDGATDGNGFLRKVVGRYVVATGEGRVFRRAVAVDHVAVWMALLHLAHVRDRQNITAGDQLLEAAEVLNPLIHHQPEHPGDQPQGGDSVLTDHRSQFFQRRGAGWHEDQLAPIQQGAPDLQCRQVEGDGGELEKHLLGRDVDEVSIAHESDDTSMGNQRSLGSARRP